MIDRLLIANRGEIACRIIRTARRMGIATVLATSAADRNARAAAMADAVEVIGPAPASDSYLRADLVIDAARRHGCDAVHPGYGFLSESAAFAQSIAAAGLTFVGPSPDAMRRLGGKSAAKTLAISCGVPVVPGYHGDAEDTATLIAEARRIGFPMLVKAVDGGGGRGMRAVTRAEDLEPAIDSARREAMAAFGSDRLLSGAPDRAPAPCRGPGVRRQPWQRRPSARARLHAAAAQSEGDGGGPGAGPVTRLAQEAARRCRRSRPRRPLHQRRDGRVPDRRRPPRRARVVLLHRDEYAAAGRASRHRGDHRPRSRRVAVAYRGRRAAALRQDQVEVRGHAIEVRLNAEDAAAGFLPSTGRLAVCEIADEPGHLRVECGYRTGDIVTPHYDNLIAKLIAVAPNRDQALDRLARVLDRRCNVAGVRTNAALLAALSLCAQRPEDLHLQRRHADVLIVAVQDRPEDGAKGDVADRRRTDRAPGFSRGRMLARSAEGAGHLPNCPSTRCACRSTNPRGRRGPGFIS